MGELALAPPAQPLAAAVAPTAAAGQQTLSLNGQQLLVKIEQLIAIKEYGLAATLAEALEQDPAYRFQAQFLHGLAAVEDGKLDKAIGQFRSALAAQPNATRARLELARALLMRGKDSAATYHFKTASQAEDLPPEVRATINSSLALLRNRKPWRVSTEVALVPDSNITSGTRANTVDIDIGSGALPFTLAGNSRQRSGLGQTANISAGYRIGSGKLTWAADLDTGLLNYKGKELDDFNAQVAFGPAFRTDNEVTQASLQMIAGQRWYGGKAATRQVGARLSGQRQLGATDRIGLNIDARHSTSLVNRDYSGWNLALSATYEKAISQSVVASASVFARGDKLRAEPLSSREVGIAAGIGGELPHGINAGLSLNVGRAAYAAPMRLFSPEPRRDWRTSARVYAGLRNVRFLGLSPSVTYSYIRNDSSLTLYKSQRSRFAFALARYF